MEGLEAAGSHEDSSRRELALDSGPKPGLDSQIPIAKSDATFHGARSQRAHLVEGGRDPHFDRLVRPSHLPAPLGWLPIVGQSNKLLHSRNLATTRIG